MISVAQSMLVLILLDRYQSITCSPCHISFMQTYDSFISQTRKDLVKEMDTHVPSVMSGAKPQIKHLSISETQRKRDQSHTRALRQRTASESSVEGSVEIPKKRGQGFAENKRSSRSSIDEDPVSSSRDVKQSQEGRFV